jgi:O-antigen ligase
VNGLPRRELAATRIETVPLKTLLFAGLFVVCCVGAFVAPIYGVLGYTGHYMIGPERQWWFNPMAHLDIRYSYTLAVATAIGIVLNWSRLRYGRSFFHTQEKLILLFLGLVWLSLLYPAPASKAYTLIDHPTLKLAKTVVFVFMLTHVVTNLKNLNRYLWLFVVGALILGLQAYDMPRGGFMTGRIERVGGTDFREANFLAAFLAAMLPIIGVQFFRSGVWGKALCLMSAAFATNGIVLTRSRGVMVGIGAGAFVAALRAPKRYRLKVMAALIAAGAAGLYLGDPHYFDRLRTIGDPAESRDPAAQNRLEIWRSSVRLIKSHPGGVGAGNFPASIGVYDRRFVNRDAHSTFLRCAAELGIPGLLLLLALIAYAVVILRRARRAAEAFPSDQRESVVYIAYGVLVSMAILLTCGLLITLLYQEIFWWLLALPVCLHRAVGNLKQEQEPRLDEASQAAPDRRAGPLPPRRTKARRRVGASAQTRRG